MMHQVEWHRDNNLVYYRLRYISGAVFYADMLIRCKAIKVMKRKLRNGGKL